MEKGMLRKRLKGLLAFSLAFYLMFGNGIQVLAEEYSIYDLADGTVKSVKYGDKIDVGSGAIAINDVDWTGSGVYVAQENLNIDYIGEYKGYPKIYLITSTSTPEPTPTPDSNTQLPATPAVPKPSTGGSHIHTLKWEIVIEPTETTDGRSEYRCECGHVEAAQPISFFRVIIMRIIKAIEEAPQNGTVVVDNKFLRCLTDEIVAALHKRSDVNLEVRFVEQEVNYQFLIPAGRAPMEEEEWFGYFYLGGRYGWIQ